MNKIWIKWNFSRDTNPWESMPNLNDLVLILSENKDACIISVAKILPANLNCQILMKSLSHLALSKPGEVRSTLCRKKYIWQSHKWQQERRTFIAEYHSYWIPHRYAHTLHVDYIEFYIWSFLNWIRLTGDGNVSVKQSVMQSCGN